MNSQQRVFTPRVLLQTLFFAVVIPFLPLLISRSRDWIEAWIYALSAVGAFAISRLLASRRHPDLLEERARSMRLTDAKEWDKRLVPLMFLASTLALVVAGLDERFGWSPSFTLGLKAGSLILLFGGYVVSSYALITNRYFSGIVRIQTDRGHQVVSSGPYRWIRHPGYLGGFLTFLATPILLDSYWAFMPEILASALLLYRTRLEDDALQQELPGYRDYSGRVRFRLLPGVW